MAANGRPGSGGNHSSAASSADMPPVGSLNKHRPHPEEWTLPHEWNIEKREMFDNWKMDVQNQIANIADNLSNSLQKHPREDVDNFDYSDEVENTKRRTAMQHFEKLQGSALNLGVARVPVSDRLW